MIINVQHNLRRDELKVGGFYEFEKKKRKKNLDFPNEVITVCVG